MLTSSFILTAAQQHSLIATANVAVSRFVQYITDKIGFPDLFCTEDLENIVGDTLYNACRSLDSYDPGQSKMTTWVSRIAVNCVKDAIDYKMKRLAISEPMVIEDEESDDEYCSAEHCDKRIGFNPDMERVLYQYSPDRRLDQEEFEQRVRGEARKLSDKNQHYLQMLEDGFSPKDMAEREGCTPNSAAKRVHDIRKAIRGAIAEIAREYDVFSEKIAC